MSIELTRGFSETERNRVARLYWEAFQQKLRVPMGPEARAIAFLERVVNPDFAIAARRDGELLGLAGFKTADGALVGGTMRDLWEVYGLSCIWRVPIVALLERELADDILLMDGIFVDANARGQGVGTRLLDAIKEEARAQHKSNVRLDVIDTNPRAKALYERVGFRAAGEQKLGPLRHIFGFSSATEMIFDVVSANPQDAAAQRIDID